jgi:hypothetical protein
MSVNLDLAEMESSRIFYYQFKKLTATLADATTYACLITAEGVLAMADRGGLEELPADPRLELIR